MDVFSLVLLVHVLGAFGLMAAVAIEWALGPPLERATTWEAFETALSAMGTVRFLAAPSALALLAAGLYLAGTRWGWTVGWIDTAIVVLVLNGTLGAGLTGRRFMQLGTAVQRHHEDPATPLPVASDPATRFSLRVRTALLVGAVALMVLKPSPVGVAVVMGIAVALGLALAAAPARPAAAR